VEEAHALPRPPDEDLVHVREMITSVELRVEEVVLEGVEEVPEEEAGKLDLSKAAA